MYGEVRLRRGGENTAMTYHDARTGRQVRGRWWRPVALRCAVIGNVTLVLSMYGCVGSRDEIPFVAFDAERTGTKMLRPGAQTTACRTRILGSAVGDGTSPVDRALRALVALDGEADALTKVTIETRSIGLGFFDRTCVTARADVVRTISVVRLPAPPGHEGHH
jgi:hypothetical protein